MVATAVAELHSNERHVTAMRIAELERRIAELEAAADPRERALRLVQRP